MKSEHKRKSMPFYISAVIIAACILFVLAYVIYVIFVYATGDKFEPDKTANVNVMLTRSDNWTKVETGKIKITKSDLGYIDGSTATIPITAELARQFCDATDKNISEYVDHNTTHNAYTNLIYTAADDPNGNHFYDQKHLIFVTEPSVEELGMAKAEDIQLDVTPVAKDGFVFIVHKDNPVNNLTPEQVQKIYSGEITNWKEVGGNNERIIPYQREPNSGSQTAMEQMVMQGKKLMDPAESYTIHGMGGLIEVIGEYQNRENSIGYTYYYYINNLYKNDNIKVLDINGFSPDNENLIDQTYQYTTSYYAVIAENGDQKAKEIRDYMISDEGQKIISMAGYCPLKLQED